jgi:hypothetical protein
MAFDGLIVDIPVGLNGLNGTRNLAQLTASDLISALNLSYADGTLQKEGGTAKYNATAITGAPSILGGWDWDHSGGAQRMIVVADDGKIYKDSGSGAFGTTLKSGLNVTDASGDPIVPVFAEGGKEAAANNRKLFIFTGRNVVQVLSADGATTSDITTPPADWSGQNQPRFGFNHEGRMWGGGNPNDPHRLYFSLTTNHEDFTTSGAGSIAVYPGEGENLVNAFSFRGGIIAFKYPVGIYFVDTSDPTVANWKVSKIADKLGSAWIGTACVAEDEIIYVDQAGEFRLLTTTANFGDFGTDSLSDIANMGTFARDNLNRGQMKKWRLVYYPAKREVHLACTGTGATVNNGRLVIDLNRRDKARFRYSDRDTAVSLWVRKVSGVPQLTAGDNAGFVRKLDQEARSNSGSGYRGEFQTAHFDFSELDPKFGTITKRAKYIELVVQPKGNWNLSVDYIWDGETEGTLQFNMGTTGASLGSFILGTDALAQEAVLNRKKIFYGEGRRLSIKGYNTGDSQDFSVARFYIHFEPGNENIPE